MITNTALATRHFEPGSPSRPIGVSWTPINSDGLGSGDLIISNLEKPYFAASARKSSINGSRSNGISGLDAACSRNNWVNASLTSLRLNRPKFLTSRSSASDFFSSSPTVVICLFFKLFHDRTDSPKFWVGISNTSEPIFLDKSGSPRSAAINLNNVIRPRCPANKISRSPRHSCSTSEAS